MTLRSKAQLPASRKASSNALVWLVALPGASQAARTRSAITAATGFMVVIPFDAQVLYRSIYDPGTHMHVTLKGWVRDQAVAR